MRPLAGKRIVELGALGPGPFCGMLLADLGADVIVVERTEQDSVGAPGLQDGCAIFNRGKRSIALNLKDPLARQRVLRLVQRSDGLIEGMRPGVAERLGLGPEDCRRVNPRLVYGRITGWGQTGPLAQAAGHDLNYLAVSGALWYAGEPGQAPLPPPTLLGDVGGGAMHLAVGMLAGLLRAAERGQGAVIDAAIVDGGANMMNLLLSRRAAGQMHTTRGASLLDGPHWCGLYRCADGRWVSVQALEAKFYEVLLEKLNLLGDPEFGDQHDVSRWPVLRQRMAALFASQASDHWCAMLEGSDACFARVLSPEEAALHPHNRERRLYVEHDGVLQAAASPRFLGEEEWAPASVPRRGEHTVEIIGELEEELL